MRIDSIGSLLCVWRQLSLIIALIAGGAYAVGVRAADVSFDEAQQMFYTGRYEDCREAINPYLQRRVWNVQWVRLALECDMQVGRYPQALTTYQSHLDQFRDDIEFRLIGRDVFRMNDQANEAQRQLEEITALIARMPWRYNSVQSLVPLGRLMLIQGEDPRQVLKVCYDAAAKAAPESIEPFLAVAELAIGKSDWAEAADAARKAIAIGEDRPEGHYLLARALLEDEPQLAVESLEKALAINSRHTPSMLTLAEQAIDRERYDDAKKILEEILAINAHLPDAWALKAVVAHLEGEYEKQKEYRFEALKPWPLNPVVDLIIGRSLSRHYRFEDAVKTLQRAAKMDPSSDAVAFELSQALLRAGRPEEGWQILQAVATNDPYNVVAYNLSMLKGRLDRFATIEADGLVIRMERDEAEIYGREVLELLTEARRSLTDKYDAELTEPVYVEIFNKQSDFAIRTFGVPGGIGYLGVCFGQLVTANSPTTMKATPHNWQSVLWHEYCHVVTLQKSANRMPRWLSEGISVYEETLRHPGWSQPLDRMTRRMLLEELTPMSKLSGAFLQPPSPAHLQFAYNESALAVEFLVERYSLDALKRVLFDLGLGLPINDALSRLSGSLESLDSEFETFARRRAKEYGPRADWELDDQSLKEQLTAGETPESILGEHPRSPLALQAAAMAAIEAKQWEDASKVLDRWRAVEPEHYEPDGLYWLTAVVARELDDPQAELEALEALAEHNASASATIDRLMELAATRNDWEAAYRWAEAALAIDPMRVDPQQTKRMAAEKTNRSDEAIAAIQALLKLDPIDPADLNLRLAELIKTTDESAALRHTLMAIEIAPRYREAYRLLTELQGGSAVEKD